MSIKDQVGKEVDPAKEESDSDEDLSNEDLRKARIRTIRLLVGLLLMAGLRS